jgi:uncharacterized membrane protein required for colicin V production
VDIAGVSTFDLLAILFFMAFFVLGFIQGAIRRLLGLGSMVFSFLFAANLAGPLKSFLAENWTQFHPDYSYMIGFGTVFVAATLAFSLTIQGFYKSQPLFERARFVDELIGGAVGVLQAGLIIGAAVVILDSFFAIPGIPESNRELPFLRDFWTALDGSRTAEIFRESVIPALFSISGPFIPDTLRSFFPGS